MQKKRLLQKGGDKAEKREGEQEEARNSKNVQKQDGTRKVMEALSQ